MWAASLYSDNKDGRLFVFDVESKEMAVANLEHFMDLKYATTDHGEVLLPFSDYEPQFMNKADTNWHNRLWQVAIGKVENSQAPYAVQW